MRDFTGVAMAQTGAASSKVSGAIASLEKFALRRADRLGVIASAFIPDAKRRFRCSCTTPHRRTAVTYSSQQTSSPAAEAQRHVRWPSRGSSAACECRRRGVRDLKARLSTCSTVATKITMSNVIDQLST